jgi:hypothetical protein
MEHSDPHVQKILKSICWAKGCNRMSALKTGFVQAWEEREKPYLCTMHQSYNFRDTHNGTFDAASKKWSCCSKRDEESFCEEMMRTVAKFKNEIPITSEQQTDYNQRQHALEDRIESDFCSSNWDRS